MIPYNNTIYPFFVPFIPPYCDKPPTLYTILESIVNGTKKPDDYTKIKDLAKEGRSTIFNFEYPLTQYISNEKFETMILNHFLMRRIGFDTVTAFRIQLDVKLNEIMPLYNKMFDSLENWNIFNDGEMTIRRGTDNKVSENSSSKSTSNSNSITNNTSSSSTATSDRRYSDTPQNKLENVRDGSYVTNYGYDTDSNSNTGSSSSSGTSTGTETTTDQGTNDTEYEETITKTPGDKIAILKEMQENIKSIYTMIFDELDSLFYQLI